MNEYLARQLSGHLVQATANSAQEEFLKFTPPIDFFRNLSIDTADEYWLEKIGVWIGYTRPLTPAGIWDDNSFEYGTAGDEYSELNGYGEGLYISSSSDQSTKMPLDKYREALKQFAYLKYNGLSLVTADKIAKIFGDDYTFSIGDYNYFEMGESGDEGPSDTAGYGTGGYAASPVLNPDSDLYIIYNTNIGVGNVWLLQDIFYRFTSAPQVFVSIGV